MELFFKFLSRIIATIRWPKEVPPGVNKIGYNITGIFYNTCMGLLISLLIAMPTTYFLALPFSLLIVSLSIPLMGFSMYLTRKGMANLAGFVTLGSLLILSFLFCYRGEGFHDMGMLIYPVTLVVAGLTLKRSFLLVMTFLVILSMFSIAFLESRGFIGSYMFVRGYPRLWEDFGVSVIIISATALFVNVIMRNILRNFALLDEQEKSVVAKNLELEREVNERIQTEQALSISEERFKNVIQNSPVVLFEVDKFGVVVLFEGKGLKAIGKFPGETVGMSYFELYRSDPVICQHGREALKGISSQFVNIEFDTVFENSLTPVFAPDGSVASFIGVSVDITAHTKALKELEGYKNQLEDLVKERTEEISKLNNELMIANEELYATNGALINQKDELEIALFKLKQTQNRLVQSEKMASLGVLVAGIAHEINNPVNFISTGIMGLKECLLDIVLLLEKYHSLNKDNFALEIEAIHNLEVELNFSELSSIVDSLIKNIEIGVERTTLIVKGLRTFARTDEKQIVSFDVHNQIDTSLLMLHNKIRNRITVQKNYGVIPQIEGYAGQISQVFMNILSNAIDAIPNKGNVFISTWYDEVVNSVRISFRDEGLGIHPDLIDRIFDPFFTTKTTGEGTGLGLSISYSIVKDHKGDLEIKSELGKGSEFIVTLPLNQ